MKYAALISCLLLSACGGLSPEPPDYHNYVDAGDQVGPPTIDPGPVTVGEDAGEDAGVDEVTDAGEDAGVACKPGWGYGDPNHCHHHR